MISISPITIGSIATDWTFLILVILLVAVRYNSIGVWFKASDKFVQVLNFQVKLVLKTNNVGFLSGDG